MCRRWRPRRRLLRQPARVFLPEQRPGGGGGPRERLHPAGDHGGLAVLLAGCGSGGRTADGQTSKGGKESPAAAGLYFASLFSPTNEPSKCISGFLKGFCHGDCDQSRARRSGGQNQTPESRFPAVLSVRLETDKVLNVQ